MKVILGTKKEMTQKFTDAGVVPVTVVSAGPCTVTQVKGAKDGYQAIQLGFRETKKKISNSVKGHLKGLAMFHTLREFRTTDSAERGKTITVGTFKVGDTVQVIGIAKGKGFQGVVKRHHFGGSPKTHGHKDQLRMPGSIGATEPKHVFKGTRMAGRMGGQQVTVKNLEIVEIDEQNNLLYIKGAVPGGRNALLAISGEGELVFTEPQQEAADTAVTEETPVAVEPQVEGTVTVETPIEEKSDITPEEKAQA